MKTIYYLLPTLLILIYHPLLSQVDKDWIVSGNDAKFERVEGVATYPQNVLSSTLTLIDATQFPPKKVKEFEVEHSIFGPPQCVAITPDGKWAFVGAPDIYHYPTGIVFPKSYVQVVDLESEDTGAADLIEIGSHPQGLAIAPDGELLLAATVSGYVAVLKINDQGASLIQQVPVSQKRLSGIVITPDGNHALVANRDEQGLTVLRIKDGIVNSTGERVSTGVGPYDMEVSADGNWVVVSNTGLTAIDANFGTSSFDVDVVTLVDISERPFRAVQHLTVPSLPEGLAISPDGRWIVVNSMNGSNLTPGQSAWNERGALVLFEIVDGKAIQRDQVEGGIAAQGVVFTKDSRYVLLQMNVEKMIGVYEIFKGKIRDTGERIELSGGPTSVSSVPRAE